MQRKIINTINIWIPSEDINFDIPKKHYDYVTIITTFKRFAYFRQCIESWNRSIDSDYNDDKKHLLIVANDYMMNMKAIDNLIKRIITKHDVILIHNKRKGVCFQTAMAMWICHNKITFNIGFKADDDMLFKKSGWTTLYEKAIKRSKYDHLCYYYKIKNKTHKYKYRDVYLISYCNVMHANGCFFTFTNIIIEKIGYPDPYNFPIRGQWHFDYSMRCCKIGMNKCNALCDARYSDGFLKPIDMTEGYVTTKTIIPKKEYESVYNKIEKDRRYSIINDLNRIYVKFDPKDFYK